MIKKYKLKFLSTKKMKFLENLDQWAFFKNKLLEIYLIECNKIRLNNGQKLFLVYIIFY